MITRQLNIPEESRTQHPLRTMPSGDFVRSDRRWTPSEWFAGLILALIVIPGISGCMTTNKKTTYSAERPSRESVRTEHFVIKSDVELKSDDPMIRELEMLQQQIRSELNLPVQRDPVVLYLFSDEMNYRYYMQSTWNGLPPRRAYFVGTSHELAVYSFRSPKMQEDLRHEFTHGVLHSCLNNVPLWLDEGLAEYFEVSSDGPGRPHLEHLRELESAAEDGWSPNLFRLEVVNDFRKMTQRDYAESWAWVHFMLQSDPDAKNVLLQYIADLEKSTTPRRLLPSLEKAVPQFYLAARNHIQQLQAEASVTSAASGPLSTGAAGTPPRQKL